MKNYTGALTVNGTANLLTLLKTAGYDGPAIIREGRLYNPSTTVTAYLHLTDSSINAPGTRQVETAVIAGTITQAGNATLTLTAAGMTGSPISISVALTVGMTAAECCRAFVNALSSNAIIADFFDISHDGVNLILTKKTTAANDATLNLAYADDTSAGLTDDATSNNTTAGALATTSGFPILSATTVDDLPGIYELPRGTDLSTTWLYTASSIPITAAISA